MRLCAFGAALAALAASAAGLKAPPVKHVSWQPQRDPDNEHRLINTHGKWSDGRIQLPNPTEKHILVVPKLKLLFCFIPKVACTQFNRLMNELNSLSGRLGSNCAADDPIFASSVKGDVMGTKYRWEMMKHSSWTKAVFLRDPLERIVSAHRSKCENDECGGCLDHNFTRGVVKELLTNDNMHYLPQHHFCGNPDTDETLGTTLNYYDFVGHLSDDHADVSEQVENMLHLALKRRNQYLGTVNDNLSSLARTGGDLAPEADFTRESLVGLARKHFLAKPEGGAQQEEAEGDENATAEDAESDEELEADENATVDDEDPNALPEGWVPATTDTLEEVAGRIFPKFKLAGRHATGTSARIASTYFTKESLEVALEYYAKDYQMLPDLKLPSWVDHQLECIRITTADSHDSGGHLLATVHFQGAKGLESEKVEGLFMDGSTVLDRCWGQVLAVMVQNIGNQASSSSWQGSVEWSPNGRIDFGPMSCATCSGEGNSTASLTVSSGLALRFSGSSSKPSSTCMGGASCMLRKAPLPPPPIRAAPTPVPTNPENIEQLRNAVPSGYTLSGQNCNCGRTLAEWTWEKPSPALCSKACEKTRYCASFAIWTSAATFDGMCKLYDKACHDGDGWMANSTDPDACPSPTMRYSPNVGFNRILGKNYLGAKPKGRHIDAVNQALAKGPPQGYRAGGRNCRCSPKMLKELPGQKASLQACAYECDEDLQCQAFSIWLTNQGICRLWDASCPDDDGWKANTTCPDPSNPLGPNVGFNKDLSVPRKRRDEGERPAATVSKVLTPDELQERINSLPTHVPCSETVADSARGDNVCDGGSVLSKMIASNALMCSRFCSRSTAVKFMQVSEGSGYCQCFGTCAFTRSAMSVESRTKVYSCSSR